MNRILPDGLEGEFYASRKAQEATYRDEIARRFARLPRVDVRQLPRDVYGLEPLRLISEQLVEWVRLTRNRNRGPASGGSFCRVRLADRSSESVSSRQGDTMTRLAAPQAQPYGCWRTVAMTTSAASRR